MILDYLAEFQGGPNNANFRKGRVPSGDDIRRWMLTAIGRAVLVSVSGWSYCAETSSSTTTEWAGIVT